MNWEVFDEHSKEYDDWFDKRFGAGAFAIELNAIKKLTGNLPYDSLEVGVGTGRFATALGIKFGIDPSLSVIKYAKERGIYVARSVAEFLPFGSSTFSFLFMIVSVCFLSNPMQAFLEAHRVLKPGGSLVLGLIFKDSSWGGYYEYKRSSGNIFYKHAYFWKKDELLDIINKTGFEPTAAVSTLFDPPGSAIIVNHDIEEGINMQAGFHSILCKKNKN